MFCIHLGFWKKRRVSILTSSNIPINSVRITWNYYEDEFQPQWGHQKWKKTRVKVKLTSCFTQKPQYFTEKIDRIQIFANRSRFRKTNFQIWTKRYDDDEKQSNEMHITNAMMSKSHSNNVVVTCLLTGNEEESLKKKPVFDKGDDDNDIYTTNIHCV